MVVMTVPSTPLYRSLMKTSQKFDRYALSNVYTAYCEKTNLSVQGEVLYATQTKSNSQHTIEAAVTYKPDIDRVS